RRPARARGMSGGRRGRRGARGRGRGSAGGCPRPRRTDARLLPGVIGERAPLGGVGAAFSARRRGGAALRRSLRRLPRCSAARRGKPWRADRPMPPSTRTACFARVTAANFCFFLTFASFFLLPLHVRALGGTERTIGVVMGTSGLAGLVSVLAVGALLDRFGRR